MYTSCFLQLLASDADNETSFLIGDFFMFVDILRRTIPKFGMSRGNLEISPWK